METSTYYVVTLKAYAFETAEQAAEFAHKLNDAFCAMPEAAEYGCSIDWHEEQGEH